MGFLRLCKEVCFCYHFFIALACLIKPATLSFLQISFLDLENYDGDLAWPLNLNNFVEWMKEKCSQFQQFLEFE
jgi:DCN1-like protein 4/5